MRETSDLSRSGGIALTLPMLGLNFLPKEDAKIFENHLNPVMLVFIGKLSPSTLRWVPISQGFSHFSVFFALFILDKLVTSSIRVKPNSAWQPGYCDGCVFHSSLSVVACLPGLILMSSLVDRWLCGILGSLSEIQNRAQVCPPWGFFQN